jgi:hypothetical protein
MALLQLVIASELTKSLMFELFLCFYGPSRNSHGAFPFSEGRLWEEPASENRSIISFSTAGNGNSFYHCPRTSKLFGREGIKQ